MDIDYVHAVIAGRHADVGAPPPLLDDSIRTRAARRLLDMSPSGDPAPMLRALGLRVEETQLPARAPLALVRGRVLIAAAASPPLRPWLVFAGLAVASLRFEVAAHSMSDVWLVASALAAG
jgi:hypothetical protein